MEGISHEAASLAGHLGLGKLIYLYDDNHITIEGNTDLAYSEDTCRRFEAYGWQVLAVDGHDRAAVAEAIDQAQAETERPSTYHLPHPHRLWQPQQAGYGQGPRRAAGSRRGSADQGGDGLAGGCPVPCP